ncbi:unnamed protein product, partial [Phaeothamnion confervicola]
ATGDTAITGNPVPSDGKFAAMTTWPDIMKAGLLLLHVFPAEFFPGKPLASTQFATGAPFYGTVLFALRCRQRSTASVVVGRSAVPPLLYHSKTRTRAPSGSPGRETHHCH